jgi:hypothetical protein
VQSSKRPIEHGKLVFDAEADLRGPADPFADRVRERHSQEAKGTEPEQQDHDRRDPCGNAAPFGGLDQRSERQRQHGRGHDRQQYGPADIKKGAEQQ